MLLELHAAYVVACLVAIMASGPTVTPVVLSAGISGGFHVGSRLRLALSRVQ